MWTLIHHQMQYEVPYVFGGKAPSLTCDSSETKKGIDCSGESRWLVARCTDQKVILPDGSDAQHEWAKANLREVKYRDAINPAYWNGRLFVAFESPHPIGHVWLFNEGHTLESYGHHGPGSRSAFSPMFLRIVDACYELPCAL